MVSDFEVAHSYGNITRHAWEASESRTDSQRDSIRRTRAVYGQAILGYMGEEVGSPLPARAQFPLRDQHGRHGLAVFPGSRGVAVKQMIVGAAQDGFRQNGEISPVVPFERPQQELDGRTVAVRVGNSFGV
jgi:hypothetical protein